MGGGLADRAEDRQDRGGQRHIQARLSDEHRLPPRRSSLVSHRIQTPPRKGNFEVAFLSKPGYDATRRLQMTMTTTNTDRIEKSILLHAPKARVWRALTDASEF